MYGMYEIYGIIALYGWACLYGVLALYGLTICDTRRNTTQHDTTQYNASRHNRTQHNSTQHDTTWHRTTWHNMTQHDHHKFTKNNFEHVFWSPWASLDDFGAPTIFFWRKQLRPMRLHKRDLLFSTSWNKLTAQKLILNYFFYEQRINELFQ